MNFLIASMIGLVLGVFGVVGGVSAYTASGPGVSQSQLYQYSDS